MTEPTIIKEPSTGKAKLEAKSILFFIHCVIGIGLMFGFGTLEPFGPLTPVGMQVLGVFLGLIYLWTFVSLLWPSLLGLLALGISDYAPITEVLLRGFGNTVPILLLFAMILFGAIQHAGVTKYMSRWFLTRKMINGRPVVFSFIFIYCTYVLGALSASILPGLLLMWAILYGVLTDVGYKKGDRYTTVMVIGTFFGAISAQAAKPFTGSALMVIGSFEQTTGLTMEYLPYMVFGFIMSTLGILIYSLMIKYIFKPDMSKIANISTDRFEEDKLPLMNAHQKILFGCIFGFIALILAPSVLPKSIWIIGLLNKFGPWGIAILFVSVLSLVKIDNKPILNFKEIAAKYIAWDIYFLVVMVMPISAALTADATGIKDLLIQMFQPILGGHSADVFSAIILTVSILITNVANNGVMGVLLMPILYSFGVESGINLSALATAMIFMLHYAIVLPAASPFAAMLFGNTDWIEPKDVIKYGLIIIFAMLVFFIVVGIPLSSVIFNSFGIN